MIACLRVRCGSSVFVQKKSCSLVSKGGGFVASEDVATEDLDLEVVVATKGFALVTVDVATGISKIRKPLWRVN